MKGIIKCPAWYIKIDPHRNIVVKFQSTEGKEKILYLLERKSRPHIKDPKSEPFQTTDNNSISYLTMKQCLQILGVGGILFCINMHLRTFPMFSHTKNKWSWRCRKGEEEWEGTGKKLASQEKKRFQKRGIMAKIKLRKWTRLNPLAPPELALGLRQGWEQRLSHEELCQTDLGSKSHRCSWSAQLQTPGRHKSQVCRLNTDLFGQTNGPRQVT